MRLTVKLVAAVAATAAFVSAVSLPALAECKRYGFTVNDYGKDGPTKDAKSLLDKLIATKMSEQGIKDFHSGKKNVSCELFLNFIVFDEHTCTAEATVCWGGSSLPKSDQTAASDDATEKKASSPAAAEHKVAKKKEIAKTSEPAHARPKTAALRFADPKKPVEQAATNTQPEAMQPTSESAETAAAKPEVPSAKRVETGSLSEPAKKPAKHHPVAHVEKPAASDAGYPTPEAPQDGQSGQ